MKKSLLAIAGLVAALGMIGCGGAPADPGAASSSLVQPKQWVNVPTSPFAASMGIAQWQIGVEHGVGIVAIGLDQQGQVVTSFELAGTDPSSTLFVVNKPFYYETPVTTGSTSDPAYQYLVALRTSEEVFAKQLQANHANVAYVPWGYIACCIDCAAAGAEAGANLPADAAWGLCLLEYS